MKEHTAENDAPLSERVRAQGINPVGTDIGVETGKRVSPGKTHEEDDK